MKITRSDLRKIIREQLDPYRPSSKFSVKLKGDPKTHYVSTASPMVTSDVAWQLALSRLSMENISAVYDDDDDGTVDWTELGALIKDLGGAWE